MRGEDAEASGALRVYLTCDTETLASARTAFDALAGPGDGRAALSETRLRRLKCWVSEERSGPSERRASDDRGARGTASQSLEHPAGDPPASCQDPGGEAELATHGPRGSLTAVGSTADTNEGLRELNAAIDRLEAHVEASPSATFLVFLGWWAAALSEGDGVLKSKILDFGREHQREQDISGA